MIRITLGSALASFWMPFGSMMLTVNILYDIFLPAWVQTPTWAVIAGWVGILSLIGGTLLRPGRVDASYRILLWILIVLWTLMKIRAFSEMIGYPVGSSFFESLLRYKRLIAPSLTNMLTAAIAVCIYAIYLFRRRAKFRELYSNLTVWGRRSLTIVWFMLAAIYIILLQYIIVTLAGDSSVEIALYKFFALSIRTLWVYLLLILLISGELLILYLTTYIFESQSSFQLMITRIIIYFAIIDPFGTALRITDFFLILFVCAESTLLLLARKVPNIKIINLHLAITALYIALIVMTEHKMVMGVQGMTSILDLLSFVLYLYLIFIGGCCIILYAIGFPFEFTYTQSRLINGIRLVIVGVVLLAMVLVSTVIVAYSVQSYESRRQYSIIYNIQEVYEVYYSQVINIVNIFLMILILSVILSDFLYKRISKPLTALSDGIKNIKQRKKIVYPLRMKKNDEIGELINQYNKMVDELEANYRQMARIEREGAWREMARQVAHEIKNPLTPMLLKVQMLERLKAEGKPGWEAKIDDTCRTIVDNIHMLTRIADEFSDFARITDGNRGDVDLDLTLRNILPLYSGYSNISLIYSNTCTSPAIAYIDLQHIRQAFINLIKNSVEAIGDSSVGVIKITLTESADTFTVTISDNGSGIPADLLEKIFEPNFTTKSKGGGIGLSIAKRIIENSGGTIGISSRHNIGTSITVELPAVKLPAQ